MLKILFFILASAVASTYSADLNISLKHHSRIFGGTLTQPHEYPFVVLALVITVDDVDFLCGGALITNSHVLTTAACYYDAVWVRFSLGTYYYNDERTDIIYDTEELFQYITLHEQFDSKTLRNNIAIVKLKDTVEFNENIQSIAYRSVDVDLLTRKDWTATIIGWGNSEDSQLISYPRHANVTMLPSAICKHYYSSQDTSSVFCSDGTFKTGACIYDEGGPLIATSTDGSRILVGLISMLSTLACDLGWPTVYVNVTRYVDWIDDHILTENAYD